MRPRGTPPMPRAMSSPREPVEMASMLPMAVPSPIRITDPLPNCFSIWLSAAASAFLRFSSILVTCGQWLDPGWEECSWFSVCFPVLFARAIA
jgi:hypothetical protein